MTRPYYDCYDVGSGDGCDGMKEVWVAGGCLYDGCVRGGERCVIWCMHVTRVVVEQVRKYGPLG